MEEQELREAKRARNFIWTAAENYDLDPLFLAFTPDGTADLYLNLIIGLTYKWFDQKKIDAFFNQFGGNDRELYEGLFWIGLENAAYQKEKKTRSAIEDLRQEYARDNLERYRKYKEYSRIDQIRNGHCKEILGEESGLRGEDAQILHAFSYTGKMTTDEIIEQTKENLWNYFSYRPADVPKKEGIYFLQKVAGAFHSIGKVSNTYVRARNYDDVQAASYGNDGHHGESKHYLLQVTQKTNLQEAKRYVEACFGKSIYTETEQEKLEQKLCTGNHQNCHLLFTRGDLKVDPMNEIKGRREKKEIFEFQNESAAQFEKNKQYFENNHEIYQNSIRKLTEKLRIHMEVQDETFPEMATHGKMNPREVWKAIYLDNPRVFERREEIEIPDFSVDILIDASSSRKQMQKQIAAQGYVLVKSMEQCGIPVQIYSYCSIRGFTVMRIFKGYEDEQKEKELFRYIAAGNNRDGLALRAAGHLMEKGKKPRKILMVLTDGSPMDDQNIGEGAFYKNKEYTDQAAVEDTVKEVSKLKQKGIQVVGIFMGSERAGKTAGKIFGKQLVKIRNISEFADAVGRVMMSLF